MRGEGLQSAAKLLVLLQLVVGLAPAGVNLCVAADGHIALEFSHAELPCRRDIERHHPGESAFDAHEFAHHACEDLPLLESRPYRTTNTVKLAAPPVMASPAPFLTAVASCHPLLRATLAADPPPETARALRTVILLI
jgi:hypothetical protein